MAKPKVIDGVSYYPASFEGKTEAQFIEHEKHNGRSTEALKKAYATLAGKAVKTNQPLDNGTADKKA